VRERVVRPGFAGAFDDWMPAEDSTAYNYARTQRGGGLVMGCAVGPCTRSLVPAVLIHETAGSYEYPLKVLKLS